MDLGHGSKPFKVPAFFAVHHEQRDGAFAVPEVLSDNAILSSFLSCYYDVGLRRFCYGEHFIVRQIIRVTFRAQATEVRVEGCAHEAVWWIFAACFLDRINLQELMGNSFEGFPVMSYVI